MGFSEKLTFLIDANGTGAVKGFKNVGDAADSSLGGAHAASTKLGKAIEGAAGKSPLLAKSLDKVGLSGQQAASAISSAMPAAALVAGGAIAAFGVKAVGDFQSLGKAVLDFQRISGASAEDSSRFVAVLDDYGIAAETGAAAISKMAKTAANSPASFEKFGVEIAKNADGTVNLQATLLNAAEAYQNTGDSSQKAALGAALFGKGYAQLIPILEKGADGADGLSTALEGVSGQQIMSQDQLDQAEETRLAMDRLQDAVKEFSLALGSGLSPVVGEFANSLAALSESADAVLGPVGGLDSAIGALTQRAKYSIFPHVALASFLGGGFASQVDVAVTSVRHLSEAEQIAASAGTPLEQSVAGTAIALGKAATSFESYSTAVEALGVVADNVGSAVNLQAGALTLAEGATKAAADAADEHVQALEDEAAALKASADALLAKVDAAREAADASFAVRNAADDYADALAELDGKIKAVNDSEADQESKTRDVQRIIDDTVQSASQLADANVRVAEETAAAAGQTLSATQRLDTFNGSMIGAAAEAEGPLRSAIISYIAAVNGIPEQKASEILALIDEGKLAEAHAKLNGASKTREATIVADAHTAGAEKALNEAARTRTAIIKVIATGATKLLEGASATGGFVQDGEMRHAATGAFGSGMFRVGEQGPENVYLPEGARVLSRQDSLIAARGGAGGASVTIHVDGNIYGDRALQAALEQWSGHIAASLSARRR